LAISAPCWAQTATDQIQSDLIHVVFPDGDVPIGESFVVQTPPNLEYTITPAPIFSLESEQKGTGNRLLFVMKSQPPGYTITIDHAVVHPTEEETKAAPWDDRVKFAAWLKVNSKDEIYRDSHFVKVGKGPDPGPDPDPEPDPDPTPDPDPPSPAPIPEPGFRVLIFYESSDTLPELQRAILAGEEVAAYLDKTCITEPDGTAGYRIYDQHADLSNELPVWQKAFQRRPQSLPWVIVSNGTTGHEGPLTVTEKDASGKEITRPMGPSDFIAFCRKYEKP
jgi:hypothetical protein